jgi:hypothetical protein
MEPWRSESRPAKQSVLAIGCTVLGAVFVVGFRHMAGANTGVKAGFLLGLLLVGLGLVAFVMQGRQTVVVDPATRTITVQDKTFFGTRRRGIALDDIADVGVGFLGRSSNYVKTYYLELTLRSGGRCSLFAPGRFYEGASDRSVVEGWRDRLLGYMGR